MQKARLRIMSRNVPKATNVLSDFVKEFDIIRGGSHGFYSNAFDDAADCILRYLQRIGATE